MVCKHNWMTVYLWEGWLPRKNWKIGSLCSACSLLVLELFQGASVAKAPSCLAHLASTVQPISLHHSFSLVQLYQHSITKLKQIQNIHHQSSVFREWNSSISVLVFCTQGHSVGFFFSSLIYSRVWLGWFVFWVCFPLWAFFFFFF